MTSPGPPIAGRIGIPDDERPRGLRERVAALRYLPALVGLVWQTHAGLTVAMIALRLVRAFVPVATLWAAKLIIDAVVALTRTPGALAHAALARRRARAGDRRRGRAPRPRVGARRVAARRPLLQSHQRPADAPRRDARSRAVRGSGVLRPSRARAAADDGPHRPHRHAARDGPGPVDARHARRGARRLQPVAARCSSPSPSSRASSARRTSPRSRTPCSSAARQSAASSTTCATSARATRRRRKSRCSGSPAGSPTGTTPWRSATTRRIGSSASGRGSSAPCSRCSARSATTAPTSRSSCAPSPAPSRSARSPSSPPPSAAAAT